jgi:type III secretion protein R
VSNAVLLALVAIVPLVLLTLTSFVKISVVLSLLRNALGAPDAPSGLVVTGLSLVLTFFVMAPVALDMSRAATAAPPPTPPAQIEPWRALVPSEYQGSVDQVERGLGPLRVFLDKHAGAKDKATFLELAGKLGHQDVHGDELWVLAPAFVTTELRSAFTMAILIFIPFLVIDLVIALGLASLGLATTPPQAIALPMKLLLFVAIDGWRLLIDSLLRGYA